MNEKIVSVVFETIATMKFETETTKYRQLYLKN
jgi:hypothetical protein